VQLTDIFQHWDWLMYFKITAALFVLLLTQSCASVPTQYKEVCADDACRHMVNRCVQIKAAGSRQTQYGVTAIKAYDGPALVDGMWSVRCKNGKVKQILDSRFKDISSYE
jgi:hypothetical protein